MPEEMTLDQFFEKLANLLEKGWVAFLQNETIRLKRPKDKRVFCVITAVAFNESNKYHCIDNFWIAAKAMGIDKSIMRDIIIASDIERPSPLRSKLLRATLLTIS